MPLSFPAPSTLALGVSISPSFDTQPTFASRAGEHLFRPLVAPFSIMQPPFTFQVRPGAALFPGRVPPSAPSRSNVFTTLPFASAFASTTVSAFHFASSALSQLDYGLLPPPVGLMAPTPRDQITRDSMSTGQHSDAFTSWSHPASATGQSPWTKALDVFLDNSPSTHERPSARGPSNAFSPSPLLDLQIFATTKIEGTFLLHIRALHAGFEGMGYVLEKRLPPAERPGQHDHSTAAYL